MKNLAKLLTATAAALFTCLAVSEHAAAADYPTRPIRLIVPYAAGGPTDLLGRLLALRMADRLGQAVFVENRAGGGGSIGVAALARSSPDGYTIGVSGLFWSTDSAKSVISMNNPIDLQSKDKDLEPVGLVGEGPYTIVSKATLPSDLKRFVDYVKNNSGKINMGSSGVGSPPHIAGTLFNTALKLDVVHVPYRGAALGLPAVASGEVDYMFDAPGTSKAFATNGGIKILAVTTLERSELLPDVPTVSEALLPGFSATTWNGLYAPAGTSPEVIARLSQTLLEIVNNAEFKKALLAANGYEAKSTSPAQFSKFIENEIRKWSAAVGKLGIKPQ